MVILQEIIALTLMMVVRIQMVMEMVVMETETVAGTAVEMVVEEWVNR